MPDMVIRLDVALSGTYALAPYANGSGWMRRSTRCRPLTRTGSGSHASTTARWRGPNGDTMQPPINGFVAGQQVEVQQRPGVWAGGYTIVGADEDEHLVRNPDGRVTPAGWWEVRSPEVTP